MEPIQNPEKAISLPPDFNQSKSNVGQIAGLELIYESAPVGLATLDTELRYIRINKRLAEMNGIPADNHIGRTIREVLPPLADHCEAICRKILETGEPALWTEYTGTTRDDPKTVRTWFANWAPIRDSKGRIVGINIMVQEITDQKMIENELRVSRDELRKRTAELELKNAELQEFAFIASHDMKEPLRKIQVFSDLVLTKCPHSIPEEAKDYLNRIAASASRMQQVLTSLLEYSRIESHDRGRLPVDLAEVLQQVITDLDQSQKVSVITGHPYEDRLPIVYGNASQYRQVFQNLISNALKFRRPEVEPEVKVYAKTEGSFHRIFVEDNGIGFDQKYMHNIFRPFQRLHGKAEFPGLGIGLAICRKIIDRHGGRITVTSEVGKGSIFVVHLPVAF